MDESNSQQLIEMFGCAESELEAMIQNEFGKQCMDYLTAWMNVTQLSLKANRLILSQCLVTNNEGHILCRFCDEGIPSWKEENSREHTAECPINHISAALIATKELKGILGTEKYEENNPMSGRSISG